MPVNQSHWLSFTIFISFGISMLHDSDCKIAYTFQRTIYYILSVTTVTCGLVVSHAEYWGIQTECGVEFNTGSSIIGNFVRAGT